VAVRFTPEHRAAHRRFFSHLYDTDLYLRLRLPIDTKGDELVALPDLTRAGDFGAATGPYAVVATARLAEELTQTVYSSGPLPPIRHIMPLLIAIYDYVKRGVDNFTTQSEANNAHHIGGVCPGTQVVINLITHVLLNSKRAAAVVRVFGKLSRDQCAAKIAKYRTIDGLHRALRKNYSFWDHLSDLISTRALYRGTMQAGSWM
jgi:hypothetical protein